MLTECECGSQKRASLADSWLTFEACMNEWVFCLLDIQWKCPVGGYLGRLATVRALEMSTSCPERQCSWGRMVWGDWLWIRQPGWLHGMLKKGSRKPTGMGGTNWQGTPWFRWYPYALCLLLVPWFSLSILFTHGLQSGGFKTVCWTWGKIVRNIIFWKSFLFFVYSLQWVKYIHEVVYIYICIDR